MLEEIWNLSNNQTAKPYGAEEQYNLGVCYVNGNGVSQDYQQAVEWFRKAAAQEHDLQQENALQLFCQTMIGAAHMLLQGDKTPADLIQAICSPGGTTLAGMTEIRNLPDNWNENGASKLNNKKDGSMRTCIKPSSYNYNIAPNILS